VRIPAHAKLNLLLRILAREAPAGYHQIETAFALLELADDLVVTRTASGVALSAHGPDLGPPDQNLAVRAARAVLDAIGHKFGVALELTKRIPVRSGLGGGSSDAAAALHAVNALAGNAVPRHELLHCAARLGADVAFFASGAPAALAWGRGERLFRVPDAYGWWDDMHPEPAPRGPLLLDAEAFSGWGSIGRLGGNDFEIPVFAKHPPLRALYERLAGTHPNWVRLCGSGSAVAAVYANAGLRDDAAMLLGEKHQQLIKTTTRAVAAPGPEPA
jgi:4-diphosphocytidyl-2-C-methyl-D-erythritol kinase